MKTIISKDVDIRDSDTHTILNSNHVKKTQPSYIGRRIWIGAGSIIYT